MIVFDLECCSGGHRFEGWFGSSEDFTSQQARGLVACPQCQSADVRKAPMAPRLTRKGNQGQLPAVVSEPVPGAAPTPVTAMQTVPHAPAMPPEAAAMFHALARMQAEALKQSRWVGASFADDARAMHYGEKDHAPIHGQATPREAFELLEEGIEVAPILFPLAPPDHLN